MSDDFEKVLIHIYEPIDSDTHVTKELWIAAPATSRKEALSIHNDLLNNTANK